MADSKTSPLKPYETITIVGVGLIGGSLGLALRRRGFEGKIIGVSRAEPLEDAKALGAIDEGFGYDDLAEAARQSDLIVLATPIWRLLELIRELGSNAAGSIKPGTLKRGTVITDVGSTKRHVLETAAKHLPDSVHFIGGHPMAGSEERGVGAADPLLFENAIYILTPGDDVPEPEVDRLGALAAQIGARPLVLPATQHDRVAAAISHLPQLLAVELVNSLDDLGDNKSHAVHLAAGGFRDMTRIGSSPFDMWKDIFETNEDEILAALEKFIERLRARRGSFDSDALADAFTASSETRAVLPKDTKGFLTPLWELRVFVQDKPGMIADISGMLFQHSINIKDMGVVKVREGETGSVRLAFGSKQAAESALEILRDAGYTARFRE